MKPSKHIALTLAIVLLVLPMALTLYYTISTTYYKYSKLQRAKYEHVVQLVLETKSIQWQEQDEELWYHNQLVDVVNMQQIGNLCYIQCYYDTAELTAHNATTLVTNKRGKLHYYTSPYTYCNNLLQVHIPYAQLNILVHISGFKLRMHSIPSTILTPPPQYI